MVRKTSRPVRSFTLRANKACWVAIIILVFMLTAVLGIQLQLRCAVMVNNLNYSKTSDHIVTDLEEKVEFSKDMSVIAIKVPMGSGNYLSVFEGEEVWVVEELTLKESIGLVVWFALLDMGTYAWVIWVMLKDKFNRLSTAFLTAYELLFCFASGILTEYSMGILFGVGSIGFVIMVTKLLVMFVVLVKSKKFRGYKDKNLEYQK